MRRTTKINIKKDLFKFYANDKELCRLLEDIAKATLDKSDYFVQFKYIVDKVRNGNDKYQWKNEKWYVAEIAVYLNSHGYKIIPEFNIEGHKIDLYVEENRKKIEFKEKFNGGDNSPYWKNREGCRKDETIKKCDSCNKVKDCPDKIDSELLKSLIVDKDDIFISTYSHGESEFESCKKTVDIGDESFCFVAIYILSIKNSNLFLHIWNRCEKNENSKINEDKECSSEIIKAILKDISTIPKKILKLNL